MSVDNTLKLPSYFSDGMILQQNSSIKVKGKDASGSRVTVSFDEESVEAVAEAERISVAVELSPRGSRRALPADRQGFW
ncbi:MAG: hypothetical protein U5K84_10420 [Alkalibacterium sp.]|nr:hypothetical protein [Alkalibacterium sp.]